MNAAFSTRLHQELLNGKTSLIESMAFVSAIREVADAESQDGFICSRDSYLRIGQAVETLANTVDGEFAEAYHTVAQRTLTYANTLT